MRESDKATLRRFADVARFRRITEEGRNEIYRIIMRAEQVDIKLHALVKEWKSDEGRESFACKLADELCDIIGYNPIWDEDDE